MKYNKMAQLGTEVVRYSDLFRPHLIPGVNIINIRRELITIYAQRYVQKAGFKVKYYILNVRGNAIVPFSLPVAEAAFVFMLKGRMLVNLGDMQNIKLDEIEQYNIVAPLGVYKQVIPAGEYHILCISLKENFLNAHAAAHPFLRILHEKVKSNHAYLKTFPLSSALQQLVGTVKNTLAQDRSDIVLDKCLFDALVMQLVVYVLRGITLHTQIWQQECADEDNVDLALAIKTYIEQHYQEAITASSVAKVFNMDLNKMNKLFKQQTEKHTGEYLKELRVNQAAHLLVFSDLTLEEIANETGFKNSGFLCGAFENAYNCLPLVYRSRKRGEKD